MNIFQSYAQGVGLGEQMNERDRVNALREAVSQYGPRSPQASNAFAMADPVGAMQAAQPDPARRDTMIGNAARQLAALPPDQQQAMYPQIIQSLRGAGVDPGDFSEYRGPEAIAAIAMLYGQPAEQRTALITEYQFAQQQGFQGSIMEFDAQRRRAGATSVNVNTGDQGPRLGTIPPGFTAVQDPSNPSGFRMEPIPGGPAAADQQEGAISADAGIEQAQRMYDSVMGVLNDPSLDSATGIWSILQRLPGTPQYRFGTRARQLEGQAFLQAFESLKGGGQITEIEGQKATQAIGRLDTAQSASDYRDALNDLRGILQQSIARQQRDRERFGGQPAPQQPQQPQAPSSVSGLSDEDLMRLLGTQ